MELKGTLIACIAVAIFSVLLTYNYTSNHYEAVIAKDKIEQVVAAQETTKLVLAKERKNGNIVDGLNAKALEQSKVIASLQTDLYKFRTSNNGLLIKSSGCKSATGTPPITADSSATGTTSPANGSCELSATTSDALIATFAAADQMRANLLIAKEYAEQVNKQRERLSNDQ